MKRKMRAELFKINLCSLLTTHLTIHPYLVLYKRTLSVNTTPIFQMWYFVSTELSLKKRNRVFFFSSTLTLLLQIPFIFS